MEERGGGLGGFLGRLVASITPDRTRETLASRHADGDSDQLVQDYLEQNQQGFRGKPDLKASESGRRILAMDPQGQLKVFFAACRFTSSQSPHTLKHAGDYMKQIAARKLMSALLRKPLPFDQEDLRLLVLSTSANTMFSPTPIDGILRAVATEKEKSGGLGTELKSAMQRLRDKLIGGRDGASKSTLRNIDTLLREGPAPLALLKLEMGEAWSDAALEDLGAMTPQRRNAWVDLLCYAQAAEGSHPSKKWLAGAAERVAEVGQKEFSERVSKWLPLIDKPRTQELPPPGRMNPDGNLLIAEPHADLLKGLAWCCSPMDDAAVARALGDAAIAAYKKIAWHGPRCKKLANAAVAALSMMPGKEPIAQMGRLNVQAKHSSSKKYVARRLNDVAGRTGQTAADLAECAVPTFDLDSNGSLRRNVGDFTAEIVIKGSVDAELRWIKGDGKLQQSIPAEAKEKHGGVVKEVQKTVKDIKKMLPAQRMRVEQLLMTERQWPVETWRERYLDQPLISNISRRLIWEFMTGEKIVTGIWLGGKIVGYDDQSVSIDSTTEVRLWHPIRAGVEVVQNWRNWLERNQVTQPFKQAHREIYVVTDAERQTGTYSNRFAAHILRQHQLAALCQARGWEYRLQGTFDSHNAPTLRLPDQNLRAEFWVDATQENQTSEMGIFLYVATDQVRFYRESNHEQIAIESVPPLLFSEIMRNVDLFVGVASLGNDPNWTDGGERPALNGYWQKASFGELGETAKTRKAVLERLIPRLKIADRCSFSEKFLHVRGDIRTYKIHLGSGNILMEPNDQYLCIVLDRSSSGSDLFDGLFLPFEGDVTLPIIISKAMMLAADKKIKDQTIWTQIGREV